MRRPSIGRRIAVLFVATVVSLLTIDTAIACRFFGGRAHHYGYYGPTQVVGYWTTTSVDCCAPVACEPVCCEPVECCGDADGGHVIHHESDGGTMQPTPAVPNADEPPAPSEALDMFNDTEEFPSSEFDTGAEPDVVAPAEIEAPIDDLPAGDLPADDLDVLPQSDDLGTDDLLPEFEETPAPAEEEVLDLEVAPADDALNTLEPTPADDALDFDAEPAPADDLPGFEEAPVDEATDDAFGEAADDAFGDIDAAPAIDEAATDDALPGFEEATDAAPGFDDATVEEANTFSSDFEEVTPDATDDALPGFDDAPLEATDDALPGDFDEMPADDGVGDDLPGFDDAPVDDTPVDDAAPADDGSGDSFDDLFGFKLIEPAQPVTKPVATPVRELPMRNWTDNTGKYQTVGRLEKIGENHIRLLKENGRHSTVPMERLSEADLDYVAEMREQLGVVALEKVARR